MSRIQKRTAKRSPVKMQTKSRSVKPSTKRFSDDKRSSSKSERFEKRTRSDSSRVNRDSKKSSFSIKERYVEKRSESSSKPRSSFGGRGRKDDSTERPSSRFSKPRSSSFRERGFSENRNNSPSRSRKSFTPRERQSDSSEWTATSFPKSRPQSFRGRTSSGRSQPSGRGGKRSFKGQYIDEKLFVNKATKTTELGAYEPKYTFADFDIKENLANNLKNKGYIKPSPIQDQSIPLALAGKDVIGIAATGTGKTAAFLIPLINKIEKDRNQKVMILTPTRELAMQVQKEFLDFTENMKLFSVACVGGSPIYPQMKQLGLGVHVVVGTPGRVQDLIARGKIKMANYSSIVLDEADRMLDMGFIDDMREILSLMPKDKQGLFFSATFNDKVRALCNDFLNKPEYITVKTRDTSGSVDQDIVRVTNKNQKVDHLHEILIDEKAKKVLIFREMKRSVDELTSELSGRGIKVLGLHGDMRNRERERAVAALKEGKIQALIATDVAARGIHISDISHVINYDIPNDYETYVHRIGRTGRGESKGIALTFI